MRQYKINPTSQAPPLCGDIDGTAWAAAEVLSIDNWPWHQGGLKQQTEARLLYDNQALYLQFQCDDVHSYAEATELNGAVYKDSCVELFAAPGRDPAEGYFNFEANCCGTFHLGFGPGRDGRQLITPELAKRIEVATSIPGPTKNESPTDQHWWLAAKLPLEVIAGMAGRAVQAKPGDLWRANFYRCGGKTDDQYACWNPITVASPDFHRPECFGRLLLA